MPGIGIESKLAGFKEALDKPRDPAIIRLVPDP